jgi:hypothetical protein
MISYRHLKHLTPSSVAVPGAPSTVSGVLRSMYSSESCVRIYRLPFGTGFWHQRPLEGLTLENYLLRSPGHEDAYAKLAINLR